MSAIPPTDTRLLVRIRNRADQQSWQEFVRIYAPVVHRKALRAGLQPADADNLTQEVFLKIARAMQRFELDERLGKFRSWFFTIVNRELITYRQKQHRQPRGSGDSRVQDFLQQQPSSEELQNWDEEIAQRLFACAAEQVRARCGSNTWEAFWRAAVLRQPHQQIAADLGMSVGAVGLAKFRVVNSIKKYIQDIEGDQEE